MQVGSILQRRNNVARRVFVYLEQVFDQQLFAKLPGRSLIGTLASNLATAHYWGLAEAARQSGR